MDPIDRLKKKRSALRSLTTKLIKTVSENIGSDNEIDLDDLKESYALIAERKTNLKILDDEIHNLIDADALEDDINLSEEYQEKCIRTSIKINSILASTSNNANSMENRNIFNL